MKRSLSATATSKAKATVAKDASRKKQAILAYSTPSSDGAPPGTKWGKPEFADFSHKGDGLVSLWSWNVNGVNSTIEKGKLQEFLKKAEPDVVCLNETKTDAAKVQAKFSKEIPACYEQHWNFCKCKNGYSGVAIFTKVKPIRVIHDIGVNKHDQEGRVLALEFEKFILISTYTPNAGEGLKRLKYRVGEWDKDFFKYLAKMHETGKAVILTGDLNVAHQEIDLYETKGKEKVPGFSPEERKSFDDFLKDQDQVDTFRELYPTKQVFSFWSLRANLRPSNRGWRLDYFLIKRAFFKMVEDSRIHNQYEGSDHCPIELVLNLKKGSTDQKQVHPDPKKPNKGKRSKSAAK